MLDDLVRIVDALRVLDAPEPSRVAAALGVPLTVVETKPGTERLEAKFADGVFAGGECGFRPASRFGWVRLVARLPAPEFSVQAFSHVAPLPSFTPGFPNLPELVVCYSFVVRGGAFKMEFWCAMSDRALRSVTLSWGPPNPGEEPVFESAPARVRLSSYDILAEILEYEPKTGKFQIRSRTELGAAPLDFGQFTREGASVVGVFASPAGPVFFQDGKRFVGAIGTTQGKIERIRETTRHRFLLEHRSMRFEVLYEERHGVGTNPYDTTREDVDLFALLVSKVGNAAFYQAYTRPWGSH